MKKSIAFIFSVLLLSGCYNSYEDVVPVSFQEIKLNPDEVFIYNGGNPLGTRLDPLLNDSIKVQVTVSYSVPSSGKISFVTNEGWFYKPNDGFIGIDNFNYTACYNGSCQTSSIKMHVEQPLDPNNCTSQLNGETIETRKDQPIEIRLFMNDMVCPFSGLSISKPDLGTFKTYSYSGGFKNIVYVYYPPKGFVGTDRIRYKIFTNAGDLQAIATITVKE